MKRPLFILCLIAIFALLAWRFWPAHEPARVPDSPPADPAVKIESPKATNAPVSAPIEVSDLAKELNSPATDIRADLRVVASVIETFRSNFLQTGNPVGSNAEITAALSGKNKLRLALLPPNHSAINRDGELCDRWGTPFFFHAESATKMEIRSAGPDKKMWTADDVIFAP